MKTETEHIRINELKWNKWARDLDSNGWRYRYLRRVQGALISILDVKEGISFLDVGCGTGWAVGRAAELVNDHGMFYGIDLSFKMIEKAKVHFQDRKNLQFIKSNVESIPLRDNFFNIIICTNSFHHYLNPGSALKEMHRLLKRGGRVYILDPTADTWLIKVIDRIMGGFEPAHVKLYSSKEFRDLFAGAGLGYVTTKSIDPHQKVHVGEK